MTDLPAWDGLSRPDLAQVSRFLWFNEDGDSASAWEQAAPTFHATSPLRGATGQDLISRYGETYEELDIEEYKRLHEASGLWRELAHGGLLGVLSGDQ